MSMFRSPFRLVKTRRARRRQVRNALHMLSVSGVVRPSHVETRYVSHPVTSDGRRHRAGGSTPITFTEAARPWFWQRQVKSELARLRNLAGNFRSVRLQAD